MIPWAITNLSPKQHLRLSSTDAYVYLLLVTHLSLSLFSLEILQRVRPICEKVTTYCCHDGIVFTARNERRTEIRQCKFLVSASFDA